MDCRKLTGKKYEQHWTVTRDLLASSQKSGDLDVFATPAMIAMMENTATTLAQQFLDEDKTTVGTAVSIRHINPTPQGAVVRAEAEIIECDGRRFLFRVSAWDQAGLIGEGTHERVAVDKNSFCQKAYSRLV